MCKLDSMYVNCFNKIIMNINNSDQKFYDTRFPNFLYFQTIVICPVYTEFPAYLYIY